MTASDSPRTVVLLSLAVLLACGAAVAFLAVGAGGPEAASVERVAGDPAGMRRPALRLQGGAGASPPVRDAEAAGPPPLPPFEVFGRSRFQRRLSLGTGLEASFSQLEAHPERTAAIGEQVRRHWPDLLRLHDGVGSAPRDPALRTPDALAGFLEVLTRPSRSRRAFHLHTVDPRPEGDLLGEGATLRVWTLTPPFDRAALVKAARLLDHLLAVAGGDDAVGFDVLATPERGKEVFRVELQAPFPVAGYYAALDDLVVIGTRWPPTFRTLLLKHELVHAWQHRHAGTWSSRLLVEGIAEYLMHLQADDVRLEVPNERFRDDFAALLAILLRMERAGISWRDVEPARLVRLRPESFYALGHLGYLLGQALVAYLGADELESALTRRSEAELAEAVARVDWRAFRVFLRAEAEGGDPGRATSIRDIMGSDLRRSRSPRFATLLRAALRRLGISAPRGWSDRTLASLMRFVPALPLDDPARTRTVLARILESSTGPLVVVDRTTSRDGPFRLASPTGDGPAGLALPSLDKNGREDFAAAFVEEVTRLLGDREPRVLAVGEGREAFGTYDMTRLRSGDRPLLLLVAAEEALRPRVAKALSRPGETVLSDDPRVDAALPTVLAGFLADAGLRPCAVLVVDLSDGAGDAPAVAEAFHLLLEGVNVAYWNPQQPDGS